MGDRSVAPGRPEGTEDPGVVNVHAFPTEREAREFVEVLSRAGIEARLVPSPRPQFLGGTFTAYVIKVRNRDYEAARSVLVDSLHGHNRFGATSLDRPDRVTLKKIALYGGVPGGNELISVLRESIRAGGGETGSPNYEALTVFWLKFALFTLPLIAIMTGGLLGWFLPWRMKQPARFVQWIDGGFVVTWALVTNYLLDAFNEGAREALLQISRG